MTKKKEKPELKETRSVFQKKPERKFLGVNIDPQGRRKRPPYSKQS